MSVAEFTLAPELAAIVRPGLLWWDEAVVRLEDERLDQALARAVVAVQAHPPEETAAVRAMYRRIGLDPTKTRPSNEALLRRMRKGQPFPRVNTLVDIINWCSLETQLPYGLYDRAHIEGPVQLRLGRDGEEYAGIRKDTVHVAGRLTLADSRGPFGNPTSDSERTMVTPETTTAMVVIFAPAETEARRVGDALALTAARIADLCGGRESGRTVVNLVAT